MTTRISITTCCACHGPMTVSMRACPHCGAARGALMRVGSGILAVMGGVSLSMTLAACYGAPCATSVNGECWDVEDVPSCGEITAEPELEDLDGDGYCMEYDCDEDDESVHAAAIDAPGDEIDSDCDGEDE